MIRLALCLAPLMLSATAARAQVYINGQIDQSVIAATAAAQATAVVQAPIPQPSSSAPPMEMIGGAVGNSLVYRRADDVQPRISRTVSGVTGAAGTAIVTWAALPSVGKLTVTPYVSSTETKPPRCYPVIGTVTTTGATIKCFVDKSLLALGVLPSEAAGAGVQFDVLALPGS
ncbi:hypothetical protein PQ455_01380 [Sphingomonas naphthae]|uniref:Secreted protein n=1 Tax=Sphingomonas naphthae TaxID=1813468 RepID=A0ABY7TLP5_9SPHN|nr:hypothetical protein [Sphingomonas naphthae]WCT73913.1 hypothetical protein PQ455_01380 [Sphingomonas naphthae]